jgi:hypothetical protein
VEVIVGVGVKVGVDVGVSVRVGVGEGVLGVGVLVTVDVGGVKGRYIVRPMGGLGVSRQFTCCNSYTLVLVLSASNCSVSPFFTT